VDAHVLGKAARLRSGVDLFVHDIAGRQFDRVRQSGLLGPRPDLLRRHVGTADDVLLVELVMDRPIAVDSQVQSGNSEQDQHCTGDEPADLPQPAASHRSTSL
jgi:hypothetical protein